MPPRKSPKVNPRLTIECDGQAGETSKKEHMKRTFCSNNFTIRRYSALTTLAILTLFSVHNPVSVQAENAAPVKGSNAQGQSACPVTGSVRSTASSASGTSSDPNRTDEISKLDASFQASYADAKAEIRRKLGPVIIVAGDVMLIKNGKRENIDFIPDEYTITKTIDHIPLDIFVLLTNVSDKPLSEQTISKLKELSSFIGKVRPEVDKSKLPESSKPRQHKIMDMSESFIASTLKAGRASAQELQTFTRSIAGLTLDNADEAESAALEKFDTIITGWHASMTADEWNRTNAIVVSGHMPRIQNSSMQYLLALFKEKQEGERVIYFEGDFDETKAIDLLVTHILDRRIAIDFYKDPWRMHRDLLSDATKKYLKKHFPGRPSK